MLQALRHASKSLVMKIILGLLALTFVVFFGNSFVGSGSSGGTDSIVEVGDVAYNAFDVSREFDQRVQQAQADPRFAGMTREQAIQLGLLDQTISQLVSRTLFDLGARDLGIVVSDADASALVRRVPRFQNSAGRFDRIQFETFLRSAGLSEQQYIEQLRGDLIRSQLIGTLNSGIATPGVLVDRFYEYNGERRIAEVVTVDAAGQSDIREPTETQLSAFYDADKSRFETPEYRSGVLVALTPEGFAKEIGITEEQVAAAYDDAAGRGHFTEPERRQVASALFATKDAAETAGRRIRAGEDFAAVVEDVTGSSPVDLGLITRGQALVEEIGAAAFAMSAGISEPVESPFGWNLVQVSEIVPRVEKSLDDVREELRRSLALERARETIFEVLETFEDARAGGATLEAAAAETRLRVQPIGPVARNGGTPSGGRADDLDRQTLATLFATGPGESSRAVERDDGGFFALRVDDIQAPRIPPLSEIRDRVATAWQDEERQMAAERTAAEIAVQARASGSLTAAAAKAGYTTTTTEPFDRNGNGADVPVEAVELVFEAKADDVVTAVTPSGVVLARLVEIVAPPADAPERARLRGALAQSISNDLQAQLANAFREQYGVDVDTAGLRRLFGTQ